MTPDAILAMPPGPELDNALAPLLGYTVEHFDHKLDGYEKRCTVWKTPDGASVNPIPLSSTWEGMRLVVEAMTAKGWKFHLEINEGPEAMFWRQDGALLDFQAEGQTAPHAVCLAALLTMEADHAAR